VPLAQVMQFAPTKFQFVFQFVHLGAQYVLAVSQHARNADVDLDADPALLRLQVYEFDHGCTVAVVSIFVSVCPSRT